MKKSGHWLTKCVALSAGTWWRLPSVRPETILSSLAQSMPKLFRLEGRSYAPTAIACTALLQEPYEHIQAITLSPDARVLGVVLGGRGAGEQSSSGLTLQAASVSPLRSTWGR